MNWCPKVYIGATAEMIGSCLKKKVEEGKYVPGLQLLTLSRNGRDLLDIRSAETMKRSDLKEDPPMICGMALGQTEAIEVVQRILEDCLKQTGGLDVKSFLLKE